MKMNGGIKTLALTAAAASTLAFATAAIAAGPVPLAPDPASIAPTDVAMVESAGITKLNVDKRMRVLQTLSRGWNADARRAARTQVMTALIEAEWYRREADQLGLKVTRASARRRFAMLVRQTFPTRRDYRSFLRQTHQTEADLIELVLSSMTTERVQQSWTGDTSVSDAEIAAEFERDPSRYAIPERRDLRLVFNSKRSRIRAARRALDGGKSFKYVARRYSQDRPSARRGGWFPGVTKEQFDSRLDRAVFGARRNELVGPVKTAFGYYIFKVVKIHSAKPQTLGQVTSQIRNGLTSAKAEANREAAEVELRTKWTAATLCRVAYATPLCGVTIP